MQILEEGTRIAGRYILRRRLGIGGMGEVWLAQVEGAGAFRRQVVVKTLAPDRRGDERIERMLADEARVLGFLHHPGIVTALDFLQTEVGPLLVLDYVDGPSLRTALKLARRKNMVMPQELVVYVSAEVARALEAAHRATDADGQPLHLVHRDVSPDNVLLSRDGSVLLSDFGVARALGNSDVTYPGAPPKGKRGYMPPEQAKGQPVGPAADIFALGRVVAEAADVGCGPELRAVIDRATADRPEDRYRNATEMAAALIMAVSPPAEAPRALSEWLTTAAPEAFAARETSPGATPPPRTGAHHSHSGLHLYPRGPNGEPLSTTPRPPLFQHVAPRRRFGLKLIAGGGAALALALPLALLWSAARGSGLNLNLPLMGLHAATGDVRIVSAPAGAEVYIDGTLRGVTPISMKLSVGRHQLRVGSPRLERWRASEIVLTQGKPEERQIDLTE
jgi:hypothetical protein